jgi:hypothetical protein
MVALLEGWETLALEHVMARHVSAWNGLSFCHASLLQNGRITGVA